MYRSTLCSYFHIKLLNIMTKVELFNIQKKYIDLLKWFEDNNFIPKDYFRSSDYYLKEHLKGNLEIYPDIKISRGYDFIECGQPSKEDLTSYDLTCNFNFKIEGNEDVMKKWHFLLGKINADYDKKHKLDSVFDDCYFDKFYNDNKVQVNFDDYHGWYMFGADYKGKQEHYSDKSKLKNLNFIIPIKIEYKIKTIII